MVGYIRSIISQQFFKHFIDPSKYFYRNRILIVKENQVIGLNTAIIEFRSKYNSDCAGLSRISEDNEIYIYSHFEPYFANRVFPCFDQPNIKATFKLLIVAHADWISVSNENPKQPPISDVIVYFKEHSFPLEMLNICMNTTMSLIEFETTQLLSE